MSKKSLDATFLHYGIRKEDLSLLETLCQQYEIDADWLKDDILKVYHEKKIKSVELDQTELRSLLQKALQKIR